MSHDSYWQIHNWMLAMSNYPPPPQPDSHHYNALYPASAGSQQFEAVHAEPLSYTPLNHAGYTKVESGAADQTGASQMHSLAHVAHELNQHAPLEEQQRHQMQHAAQLQHPPASHPQQSPSISSSQPPQPQQHSAEHSKSNRLRKACDSCSIRKVKVCVLARSAHTLAPPRQSHQVLIDSVR